VNAYRFIPVLALAALSILHPSFGQPPPERKFKTVRLLPRAFPELPKNLLRELERRGCQIPQAYTDRRHNVIEGEFARPGQTDWAVLCSSRGFISLLVFWNGSERKPTQLWTSPEGGGSQIFAGFIRPVGEELIMRHYRAYGGPKPPPIGHEGIESGGESASVVFYCYRGKWLRLQGAD
jgi:hypothetical protein